MLTLSATEVKNHFGQALQSAAAAPLAIEKNGSITAVMLSAANYARLQEAEDALWALRAKVTESEGFLSEPDTDAWLGRMKAKLGA
jgi:antitoxin Phd